MAQEVLQTSFDVLCRICSKKFDKNKLTSIFKDEDTLEKISSFLPIMIHLTDNLPHQVCESCLNIVDSTYELIFKAQSSEKYFMNILNNLNLIQDEKLDEPPKKKSTVSLDLTSGKFGCDICNASMNSEEQLEAHIEQEHNSQSFPPNTPFTINKICSLCGQLFDTEEKYSLHKSETQHQCSTCNTVVSNKCMLNRHIQHSCEPLSFCQMCYKTFPTKQSLFKHLKIHTEAIYNCLACQDKGAGDSEHTCAQSPTDSSKKYKCFICGQSYKRQINLSRHCIQHGHKSNWKFSCMKCDQMFEKEKLLHVHYERDHKMPKTWICRFCGKSLATKLSLQIHERIHTQVKPYVCEWCGNAFRSKANLIQHHAKHTGVKRHKCPVCGKMFSRTFFLKTHLRVHTGERPYQCDICEQRFTQVGDMRRHRKRHDQPPCRKTQTQVIIVRRPTVTAPVITVNVGADQQVNHSSVKLENHNE